MTAAHTMSPGQIVHFRQTGATECVPAIMELGRVTPAGGFVASLVLVQTGVGPGRSTKAVARDAGDKDSQRGLEGLTDNSWHWTDECPMTYPQTD